jgi:hypothetical protein
MVVRSGWQLENRSIENLADLETRLDVVCDFKTFVSDATRKGITLLG